jgi:gamma-glutamylcyclotransferase (GGCT)/AIG2-like uncharacterized protein YtfP
VSQYLFVYGTLRPGFAPGEIARVVEKLKPVGDGFVRGVLYDLGHFPGAMLHASDPDASSSGKIFGTVFELPEDPQVLRALDTYEDFYPNAISDSQFVRVEHAVELADGRSLLCWIYIYNLDPVGARIITNGRYRKRTGS